MQVIADALQRERATTMRMAGMTRDLERSLCWRVQIVLDFFKSSFHHRDNLYRRFEGS